MPGLGRKILTNDIAGSLVLVSQPTAQSIAHGNQYGDCLLFEIIHLNHFLHFFQQ